MVGIGDMSPSNMSPPPNMFPSQELRELPLQEIEPNLSQPRRHFDETTLDGLADSLRERCCAVPESQRGVEERGRERGGERGREGAERRASAGAGAGSNRYERRQGMGRPAGRRGDRAHLAQPEIAPGGRIRLRRRGDCLGRSVGRRDRSRLKAQIADLRSVCGF